MSRLRCSASAMPRTAACAACSASPGLDPVEGLGALRGEGLEELERRRRRTPAAPATPTVSEPSLRAPTCSGSATHASVPVRVEDVPHPGENASLATRSGSRTGAPVRAATVAGSGASSGRRPYPAARVREPPARDQPQPVAVDAHATAPPWAPSAARPPLGDDADQVVDGVGRRQVERHPGEGGQPSCGGAAPPPGGLQLEPAGVQVGLHLEHAAVPHRPGPRSALPPRLALVEHVVGDVLGALQT